MSLAPRINTRTLPLIVTSVLFALLFGFGSVSYDAFFSPQAYAIKAEANALCSSDKLPTPENGAPSCFCKTIEVFCSSRRAWP